MNVVGATSGGYAIKELAWNSADPYALYPSKVTAATWDDTRDGDMPIGDAAWTANNSPWSEVIVGGSAWDGLKDGSLAWGSDNPLSFAYAHSGLVAVETA